MFMIGKLDKPLEARFLHDLRARNTNTIMDHTPIPDQQSIINNIFIFIFFKLYIAWY